jgi:hypothetical protein
MPKNVTPHQPGGGPAFTPDIEKGIPSRKVDKKSEDIREKHGKDYENYPGVNKTQSVKAGDTAR